MIQVIYCMGMTNAGKTTTLEKVAAECPEFGLVQVGKLLRAKYPPEHFQGQMAPASTEVEAWELMLQGIAQCHRNGKKVALVDGQPRSVEQARGICRLDQRAQFVFFDADRTVREKRAVSRGSSPSSVQLSLDRLTNDYAPSLEVLVYLLSQNKQIHIIKGDGSAPEADLIALSSERNLS